jgi:hypothetical protein
MPIDQELDELAYMNPDLTMDEDFGGGPSNPRKSLYRRLQLQAAQQLTENPDPQYQDYTPDADQSQYAPGNHPGMGTDNGTLNASDNPLPATQTDEMEGQGGGEDSQFGLPGTMPASGARASAASRLERARGAVTGEGGNLKQELFKGALQMLPALIGGFHGESAVGAAQGANQAAQLGLQRKYTDINNAQQDYQFEAGREERERDLAIRQKLAEAQLSSQRAYRTLMASISSRKADTGAANAEVNALGKGMVLRIKDDGTTEVVPATKDQMSAIQNAKLGLAQAQTELTNARAKAVPEMVTVAQKRVEVAKQLLQRSLAALQVQQANQQRNDATFELNNGITTSGEPSDLINQVPNAPTDSAGNAVPYKPAQMLGPSGQEKSRAGAALSTQKLFRKLAREVLANKGRIGPIMGRVSMAQLLAGNVPPEMSKIAALTGQAYAVATTAHGWRSAEAPAKFEQSIGYMNRDPDAWASGLLEAADDMDTLIEPGTTVKSAGAGGGGAAGAASRLKRRSSSSSDDSSAGASAPPRPSHVPSSYTWKKGSRGYGWYKPGVN